MKGKWYKYWLDQYLAGNMKNTCPPPRPVPCPALDLHRKEKEFSMSTAAKLEGAAGGIKDGLTFLHLELLL
jgi:hypothetical protein